MALEVQAFTGCGVINLKMWKKIVFIAILAAVKCNPVQVKGVAENLVGAVTECIETDTSLCLKVNIVEKPVFVKCQ